MSKDNVLELAISANDRWKVIEDGAQKIGMFQLPRIMLIDNPGIVAAIMAQCIITRAECVMHSDLMEYVAYCPQFEWVADGAMPTIYEWQITDQRETSEGPVLSYVAQPKPYVVPKTKNDGE